MDKIVASHRRLAILKTLHKQIAQSANERVMADWLDVLAPGGARDVVRTALELAEMAVIKTDMRALTTIRGWSG